jgi:hypothetical protein
MSWGLRAADTTAFALITSRSGSLVFGFGRSFDDPVDLGGIQQIRALAF